MTFLEGPEHAYTCECGRAEYQDAVIELFGKTVRMPRISWCPACQPDDCDVSVTQRFPQGVAARAEQVAGGTGLYIFGGTGTLKTQSAKAIAECLRSMGKRVSFTTMQHIVTELHDCIGSSMREGDVYSKYASCDILFIDDVGKEQYTDSTVPMLFRIVDDRYARRRPIVFTSNHTLDGLMERISYADESTAIAIGSRIAEMCEMVEVAGPDRRVA